MSERIIDPERRESTAPTMVDDRGHRHAMPKVDWERAESLKPSRLQGRNLAILVNVVAGVGFILFGYDQGVMSGLLTLPSFEARFPQTAGGFGGSRSAVLQSFMVAIYQIGCMVGALLNLWIGDKLGRKPTIVWGGFGILAGTVLQAASVNYDMLCVARVFNGIFNGLLTSTVPAYQSECAKPHLRGKLVLISGSLITFGVMTSYWVDLGFFFTDGEISWRFPIALQSVFTIAMIVCIWGFRVPESPRWLASKGRHEEALAVLAQLEGTTVHDKEIVRTWQGMVESLSKSAGEFSLGELTTGGPSQHLRRTILGVAAQCFQQIGGINLITYYLTSVLTDMGLDAKMSRIISGVNGTCYFGTSLFAILVIERAGRRPLMYWTALLQCATMVLLAGLYNLTENGNKAAQGISVLCLFLFNTWFSVGWLGMTWLYPAEVTPLRIRAPANALSTASNWLFNFFVVMATGPMFANIRWGTYAFFAAMNGLIIFPCVYIFFPETKKYSLEELDMIFAIGYAEGRNPVGVSRQGDLPEIGTDEADKYFTGKRFSRDEVPVKKRFSIGHSDREKNKETVQHVE